MIPEFCLVEWQKVVPWVEQYQVEQDLIISRVLVELYADSFIRENLIFRGGTALNKIYFYPGARYSEDIDLVQLSPEPIGKTLDIIREILRPWLGEPKRKLTERSAKLIYVYQANNGQPFKVKIEINTTEHFHIFDLQSRTFNVANSWFNGESKLSTYTLDELIATKLRALYQRSKGRDLFNLWLVLKHDSVDVKNVIKAFTDYAHRQQEPISRAMFEMNLFEKSKRRDFASDVPKLLPRSQENWEDIEAFNLVKSRLVNLLPGESWKSSLKKVS